LKILFASGAVMAQHVSGQRWLKAKISGKSNRVIHFGVLDLVGSICCDAGAAESPGPTM
jgi:hypothetical protein